jgi:hypothetical protein
VVILVVGACPAEARSLRIVGVAGYLSEWELNAEVTATASRGHEEFSGRLTLKHVGLCSQNGPEEKFGKIKFHISKAGLLSQIHATLLVDGAQCTYSGKLLGGSSGFMDCPHAKAIPLTLSVE